MKIRVFDILTVKGTETLKIKVFQVLSGNNHFVFNIKVYSLFANVFIVFEQYVWSFNFLFLFNFFKEIRYYKS